MLRHITCNGYGVRAPFDVVQPQVLGHEPPPRPFTRKVAPTKGTAGIAAFVMMAFLCDGNKSSKAVEKRMGKGGKRERQVRRRKRF